MEQKNNYVYGIAYGKLYIAGEYAILEDNSSAILTTVDKTITAIIEPSEKTTIYDNLHNKEITMNDSHEHFFYIQKLISFIRDYVKKDSDFSLTIHNELHGDNKKYGLGSSGAVLVAITKAMLHFYKVPYTNEKIFKLVALFNILNNISGSMGDIAASCNEGLTYYKKFEEQFLRNLISEKKSTGEIIEMSWQGLEIKNISPNVNIEIFAQWTGEVVDTKEHVKLWKEKKNSVYKYYKKFVDTSNKLTIELKQAIEVGCSALFLTTINKLRENLLYLEKFSGIPMETTAMKNYINNFSAGKQSGSGSGDIVLGFRESKEKFKLTLNLKKLQEKNLVLKK